MPFPINPVAVSFFLANIKTCTRSGVGVQGASGEFKQNACFDAWLFHCNDGVSSSHDVLVRLASLQFVTTIKTPAE